MTPDIILAHPYITAWATLNVAVLALAGWHGRRVYRNLITWLDESIAEKVALREEVADAQDDLKHANANTRAARAELTGYRSAVDHLTANPTTIIIDPYRKAARDGEAAPI